MTKGAKRRDIVFYQDGLLLCDEDKDTFWVTFWLIWPTVVYFGPPFSDATNVYCADFSQQLGTGWLFAIIHFGRVRCLEIYSSNFVSSFNCNFYSRNFIKICLILRFT